LDLKIASAALVAASAIGVLAGAGFVAIGLWTLARA
jgi:hypothetical protein